MNKEDFKNWRHEMGYTSQRQAAEALGLSRSAIEQYETGIRKTDGKPALIPYSIGLACAALKHNLKPYGS